MNRFPLAALFLTLLMNQTPLAQAAAEKPALPPGFEKLTPQQKAQRIMAACPYKRDNNVDLHGALSQTTRVRPNAKAKVRRLAKSYFTPDYAATIHKNWPTVYNAGCSMQMVREQAGGLPVEPFPLEGDVVAEKIFICDDFARDVNFKMFAVKLFLRNAKIKVGSPTDTDTMIAADELDLYGHNEINKYSLRAGADEDAADKRGPRNSDALSIAANKLSGTGTLESSNAGFVCR